MMNRQTILKLRKAILLASAYLPDETALEVPDLFAPWDADMDYAVGDRIKYRKTLYKCLIAHHSQPSWMPDVSPSLWVRVTVEEWPEWVQPVGSTDAYKMGDKVTHNGRRWISYVDNNVWEPGVWGWNEAE